MMVVSPCLEVERERNQKEKFYGCFFLFLINNDVEVIDFNWLKAFGEGFQTNIVYILAHIVKKKKKTIMKALSYGG
jgi:hypothetical protein